MMFTKKWKMLKSQAEALASQTGAEMKIVIYNPDNKKTENFHTSNITKTREPGAAIKMSPLLPPPPIMHSQSKSLTLRPPVNFHLYATTTPLLPTSNLTMLPGGQFNNLVPQKLHLLKTKKSRSTKRTISDKIYMECNVTYNFPRDKELKKSKKYQWIRYDGGKCKFWGHVKCLSITVGNIKNEFLCPEHKN